MEKKEFCFNKNELVCCLNLDRVVCVAGEILKQTSEEEILIVSYVHGMEYEAICLFSKGM